MFNKTCDKCLTYIEAGGNQKINFCSYCGAMFPIDAKAEQPFHLPERKADISAMALKSINYIDRLLNSDHAFPLDLFQALRKCRDLSIDIRKSDRSNRDETKETLKRIKDDAEQDWLEDPEWFDKIKKL